MDCADPDGDYVCRAPRRRSVVFVGNSGLHELALTTLLCQKFAINFHSVGLEKLLAEYVRYTHLLIVINCSTLGYTDILRMLEKYHEHSRYPTIALINAKRESEFERLGVWPQVVGIFYHDIEPDRLLDGFAHVLNGGLWLPRRIMERMLQDHQRLPPRNHDPNPAVKLTRRQLQILEKLSEGKTNTLIANSLFLSEHTVKSHIYTIYRKVNVKNRTEAANWLTRSKEMSRRAVLDE